MMRQSCRRGRYRTRRTGQGYEETDEGERENPVSYEGRSTYKRRVNGELQTRQNRQSIWWEMGLDRAIKEK